VHGGFAQATSAAGDVSSMVERLISILLGNVFLMSYLAVDVRLLLFLECDFSERWSWIGSSLAYDFG
jgi:hypothetical protein